MDKDFDIEYQLYLEEKELAAKDPNYCERCLNWRVLYDDRGGSEPCPDCKEKDATPGENFDLQPLRDALNGEDEATVIATNGEGVTIEVTHYCNPLGGSPFWIWQEAGLVDPTPDDIHLSFNLSDVGEKIFAQYRLDIDAAIWTRQQAEPAKA